MPETWTLGSCRITLPAALSSGLPAPPSSCPVDAARHRHREGQDYYKAMGAESTGCPLQVSVRICICPMNIPVPKTVQHQMTNLKYQGWWKDRGRKETAFFHLLFKTRGSAFSILHWVGQIPLALTVGLPALDHCAPPIVPSDIIATHIEAGLILLPRASHHTQGKDVAQLTSPRGDRDA